jgi:hypothetical protein
MSIYVITNPHHGWDCVIGVYSTYSLALNNAIRSETNGEKTLSSFGSRTEAENWLRDQRNLVIHETTLDYGLAE